MPSHCLNQWWHCQKGQTYVEFNSISAQYVQLYQSFWWFIQSFPNILDISSSVFKFRWKKPISSIKPLWFSLSGIELVNKNATEKYLYSAHFYCCFTYSSIFKLFHIFSSFFRFRWKKPISSSKPSPFPGNNEHVNSNATVKYWYSAQLCCCFISLENYNFLQEKILPTRYSSIFKLFLNLYPSFFHFKWKKPISSRKPALFLVSLLLEGIATKYLYSAHFWLLFH